MRAGLLLLALLAVTAGAAQAQPWRFHLGAGPAQPGWTVVRPGQDYTGQAGYGFEPGASAGGSVLFSVHVPEGDYRVTLTLAGAPGRSGGAVKAEARRLMVEAASSRPATHSFIVNVRRPELAPPPPNAPAGTAVRLNAREQGSPTWDDRLTLEFAGLEVSGVEVEPVALPRLFLLGDSTVTDQRYEDGASWGQMLPRFLDDSVAVANHAESGETLKSFITELRLDKVLSQMRPGDWAVIQFGHNDSKAQWPQTHAPAETTFRSYLRLYIDEVRRRGGTPMLATSPHRRTFGPDGRIRNSHGGYPDAVRAVGRETGVPVLELNGVSAQLYEALGPERSPAMFADGGRDATHHNNYGAYLLAQGVAAELRRLRLPLAGHLRSDVPAFDPSRPLPPERFTLPASAARSAERPRGS